MAAFSPSVLLAAQTQLPSGRRFPAAALFAGAATLASLVLLWRPSAVVLKPDAPSTIKSPRDLVLPYLSVAEIESLPYPPDALPGARDVNSPYGSIRIYEFGPESGDKVLLVHGISTPSIALTDLAYKLAAKGCRVMLFDLFGRGYSSGPSPQTTRYDSALYTSQILLCLQSSPLAWKLFTLVGYSLGGAISADFTSYFPNLVRSLILVAPGGLIRTSHITWKSRFLYSTSGLLPERVIERLVAQRLWTGPETARTIEPEPDTVSVSQRANHSANKNGEPKGGLRSHAVYASSRHGLLPGNVNSTVSNVVDWQILHHQGFVPAFISSIRYAPVHNQHHRWRVIRENIERQTGILKKVWLVLGEQDPIIVAEEVAEDAAEVLGQDNVKVKVVKGSGHEVAIERADEIVGVVTQALDLE